MGRPRARALTDVDPIQARRLLATLSRAHLVQPVAAGRFGMHDLLRAYARDLAARQDAPAELHAARHRLLAFYLHTADHAMDEAFPAESAGKPQPPPARLHAVALDGVGAARAWLGSECANLTAAVYAAGDEWHALVVRVATMLWRLLDFRGLYGEIARLSEHTLRLARRTGNQTGELLLLSSLAGVHYQTGEYHRATDLLERALAIARDAGDQANETRLLNNLAGVLFELGEYDKALECVQRTFDTHIDTGNLQGLTHALDSLGEICRIRGDYHRAINHYQQALAIHRRVSTSFYLGITIGNLGIARTRLGQYRLAAAHLQHALRVFREVGFHQHVGVALDSLGVVHRQLGQYAQAIDHHRQALEIHRRSGSRRLETEALNNLGDALHEAGRPAEALTCHQRALALACDATQRYQQGRAHDGIARVHNATGERDQASEHWREALRLFSGLGVPEAEEVGRRLHPVTAPG